MTLELACRPPSSRAAAIASANSSLRDRQQQDRAQAKANKVPRKPVIRVFPSSLKTNSYRAEGLFKLLRQTSSSCSSAPPSPPSLSGPSSACDGPSPSHSKNDKRGGCFTRGTAATKQEEENETRPKTPVQDRRRSTRSTDKIEEWIKIPVEATVHILGGELRTLEGIVYLSAETSQLYKKSNLVFFEATWEGDYYNYLVPEIELPMITTDHPVYVAQLAKIEATKRRKLQEVKELLKLSCGNVDAMHEFELLEIDHTHNRELLQLKTEVQNNLETTIVVHHHDDLDKQEQQQALVPTASAAAPRPTPAAAVSVQAPSSSSSLQQQQQQQQQQQPHAQKQLESIMELLGASQVGDDKCQFDDVLRPTTAAAAIATAMEAAAETKASKANARKRPRSNTNNDDDDMPTGAGDVADDAADEQEQQDSSGMGSEGSTGEDEEEDDSGYRDIVEIFQERLLKATVKAQPGRRRKRRKARFAK